MQKKAQTMGMVGSFIVLLTVVVLGITLMLDVAQTIGEVTDSQTANTTLTTPLNGVSVDLVGQELLTTPVVRYVNDSTVIVAANWTIDETVSTTTGVKTIQYTTDNDQTQNAAVYIQYDYGADGYMSGASAAIAGLIAIFFALAIAVLALEPTLRQGLLDKMGI